MIPDILILFDLSYYMIIYIKNIENIILKLNYLYNKLLL